MIWQVPHSTHRPAYGRIAVPVTVLRNGGGPTLVVAAGIHGDITFPGQP